MQCIHFIGFRDAKQYWAAVRVWGYPDFVHKHWDYRVKCGGEYHPQDILVFGQGTETDTPNEYSFNDSEATDWLQKFLCKRDR